MANHKPTGLTPEQEARIKQVYEDIYSFKTAVDVLGLTWKPSINRVLVLTDPISAVTASGLIIPDTAKERPDFGTVVAVGPGRYTEHAVLVPNMQQVGNRVQFGSYSGTWVYDEKLDLMLTMMLDADALVYYEQPHLLSGYEKPATPSNTYTEAQRDEDLGFPAYASGDARI